MSRKARAAWRPGTPPACSGARKRLGQGQGCGAQGVAGLEQGCDAGMVLQDRSQPVRERGDLLRPGQGGVGPAVDLGEYRVEDEVVKLFLAADVPVQRAGNHAEAAGQARMLRDCAPPR